VTQLNAGDLPPVLDVEVSGEQSPSAIAAAMQQWLNAVQQNLGRTPIIYTAAGFWNTALGAGTLVLSDALAPTLKGHMERKGRSASKYDVRFLLAYVRLPGRGAADLKSHASFGDTLSKACKILESPTSNWLGTLFLCPGTPDTETRFYEGSNAAWPPGGSASQIGFGMMMLMKPTAPIKTNKVARAFPVICSRSGTRPTPIPAAPL
jgi:hypothetical protein